MKTRFKALELLILGIAVGLLTAPRTGTATREIITSRLTEALHLRR